MNWTDPSDLENIAGTVQSLITTIAILLGGFWSYILFVKRRQDYPKAKIEHKVTHRAIDGNMMLLSVDVFIYNTGDILLSLLPWEITIKQMLPPRSELLRFMKDENGSNENGKEIIEWNIIASKKVTEEIEKRDIEPGEYEQIHYDFLIKSKVATVLLESYFKNRKKFSHPSIGWHLITTHDLNEKKRRLQNVVIRPIGRNKQSKISFGQGKFTKASVEPAYGKAGTTFYYNCVGFDPNTAVTVEIINGNERIIYNSHLTANESGSLGGMSFDTEELSAGSYKIIVKGTHFNKLDPAIVSFDVL